MDSLKGMLMAVKLRLKLGDGTSSLEVSLRWPVMLLVLLICPALASGISRLLM